MSLSGAIETRLQNEATEAHFYSNDSSHYSRLATQIVNGESPFDDITNGMSHRQLLYPSLLAVATFIAGESTLSLSYVNLLIVIFSILFLCYASWKLFNSCIAGSFASIFLVTNLFYTRNVTTRLLTEPLFILTCCLAIYFLINYFRSSESKQMIFAIVFASLSYLTRPNGLFFTASLILCLVLKELFIDKTDFKSLFRKIIGCVSLFLLITSVTWIPKLFVMGNPFDHGYLTNFLWVDSYEVAQQRQVLYSFSDYAQSHTPMDALRRFKYGLVRIFYDTPIVKFGVFSSLLMFAGILWACILREKSFLLLLLFMFVNLLPIVWSNLANPTLRIPAASIMPFGLFFMMFAVASFTRLLDQKYLPFIKSL